MLCQQGYSVARDSNCADGSTINLGKRAGGPEAVNLPRSCPLVTAPTNAQLDNLLKRVHEESYSNEVFRDEVLANQAPWLRLCAQRATAPLGPRSFDEDKVQQTMGRTRGCKHTIGCALSSCGVVFAIAGMIANLHKLLLGAASGKRQTRFAFSFVDEASKHRIRV